MVTKVLTTLLVVLFANLSYYIIEGRILTDEEDFELEEQLRILNKQPIKSIEDEFGDVFDCIEINKQPALDHPLLKNHEIQMEPTFLPKSSVKKSTMTRKQPVVSLQAIDCPHGTVPIRRTRKKDLVRAKLFMEMHSTIIPYRDIKPGQHPAIVRSNLNSTDRFHGAGATMNLHNPEVADDQSTWSQIWLGNGIIETEFDGIQAGWAVAPELYQDHNTRFVTYWESTSQGKKTGCFNDRCAGFVHVDNRYTLDGVITKTSIYDGPIYSMQLLIFQDIKKNWWLTIPDKSINIGYWPNTILPHLAEGASNVAWGGLAMASANGNSPVMGFGTFPDGNYRHSGFFWDVVTIDAQNKTRIYFGVKDTYVEAKNCYSIRNGVGEVVDSYLFGYGGPGGACGA
ncbi:hypothetical protein IFM89_020985 [Coptis chinensis]|uniref:Neprosin PEP catalytic domain-containing protein n=1 Tax=Coptis chinensis TaxID=261450 RepID=A0A835M0A1_9MAGN|nr:hypothetical protein IFM89_020985 [Coptis chinensis]